MSVCKVCEQELPPEAFRPKNQRTCRACETRLAREYRQTEAYREVKRRYVESEKGKEAIRRREERPEVRARRLRYSLSPIGRERQRRYAATEKGKATQRRVMARYRGSEKDKTARAKREARRRGWVVTTEMTLTAREWLTILNQHKRRCFYCKEQKPLTMDHVIPLSKGGRHSKENVVPACMECNRKKSNHLWLLC